MALLLLAIAGAVVYLKYFRHYSKDDACENAYRVCGNNFAPAACKGAVEAVNDVLVEEYTRDAIDCMARADTCDEAVDCLVANPKHVRKR